MSTVSYDKVATNKKFGNFNYRDLGKGRIEVSPIWIAANMVKLEVPQALRIKFPASIQVHYLSVANWQKAFDLLLKQPELLKLIETFDGVYVARHIRWDPTKGISNHAWGTAIDLNASRFPLGTRIEVMRAPNNPNNILFQKVFKEAGFSWGNSYADPMHFELL
ncbi:MAG: M15 family metallopeptidase [Cellulosilyticaceae bacterium]